MELQQGVWSQIEQYSYIQAADQQVWRVEEIRQGWLRTTNARGEQRTIPPQAPDLPVTFLVPTLAEAEQLLWEEAGAVVLSRLEALAAQPARAARHYSPIPPNLTLHLFHKHGHYAAGMKPKAQRTFHAEIHDDPTHLMALPHHH